MKGTVKIEVKLEADDREYNFFFPQNANIHELINVSKALLSGFEEARDNAEKLEKDAEGSEDSAEVEADVQESDEQDEGDE